MKRRKILTVWRMPQQGLGCGRGEERGRFCQASPPVGWSREETGDIVHSTQVVKKREGRTEGGGPFADDVTAHAKRTLLPAGATAVSDRAHSSRKLPSFPGHLRKFSNVSKNSNAKQLKITLAHCSAR